jgi:hypothetical protein
MTKEEVIASAKHWGLDMSGWEEKRIQQIVDIVNAPLVFPPTPPPPLAEWPAPPFCFVVNWR